MKRSYLLITTAFLLLLPAMFVRSSAAADSELMVIHSDVVPVIDGVLEAGWNDTTRYLVNLTGPSDVELWIYLKHNGTYIYVGLLINQYGIHDTDQFYIYFDEGNDGGYGSGTRDNVLTADQEDLKTCRPGPIISDGYYDGPWRTFNTELDFKADCAYEVDHSTSTSEIEYWEGVVWIDDHWECEFAVPFVGNDGGSDDVSDLNCTVADTLGLKIQWFTQPGMNNYFYPAENQYQIDTYVDLRFQTPPTIESCNVMGTQKDAFDQGEVVYLNGYDFAPSQSYDLYIVEDVMVWSDGMAIPSRVADTATSVSSDILGDLPPTAVWADPQTLGEYDVIVDVNGNGLYDMNVDTLDDNDIMVTAGFFIPEFTTILPFLILGASFAIAMCFRRQFAT